MKYYSERKNLLPENLELKLDDILEYFYQVYEYFCENDCFEYAYWGVRVDFPEEILEPPTMQPSPSLYFLKHLQETNIYPISYSNYKRFSEEQLFTIIEILYNHIAKIEWLDYRKTYKIKNEEIQMQFREHINAFLKHYKGGYYLSDKGIIMDLPANGLRELIEKDVSEDISSPDVIEKINSATKLFYRFDSNLEIKKKAINILADTIEPIREDLKNLFNSEWGLSKNKHDNLIFQIVNNFEIRHNNDKQSPDYSKDIWYEWMFHYYLSVIFTFYRLQNKYQEEIHNSKRASAEI